MNENFDLMYETQTAQVLEYLKTGATLSQLEALNLVGSLRLSSIIHRLRKRGVKIITTMQERESGAAYAVYSLARD